MKSKIKIAAIFLTCAIVFFAGISVAYHNTKTFGFDEDAEIIEYADDKITIFDYEIYYDDINFLIEKAERIIPDKPHIMNGGTAYRQTI